MKIPYYVKCEKCNEEMFIVIESLSNNGHNTCKCGQEMSYVLDNSFTIGVRLLHKSKFEYLINKDNSMSIIISAAAFDCELARLYYKWSQINNNSITDKELEEQMRRYKIKEKIEETVKLMYPQGFNQFVHNSAQIANKIKKDFPSLDLDKLLDSFQQHLFWPRNRILHLGHFAYYKEEDAIKSHNIARLGIEIILHQLDQYKAKTIVI